MEVGKRVHCFLLYVTLERVFGPLPRGFGIWCNSENILHDCANNLIEVLDTRLLTIKLIWLGMKHFYMQMISSEVLNMLSWWASNLSGLDDFRTELCRFSGAKIYPGKGIRFVRSDSQVICSSVSKAYCVLFLFNIFCNTIYETNKWCFFNQFILNASLFFSKIIINMNLTYLPIFFKNEN